MTDVWGRKTEYDSNQGQRNSEQDVADAAQRARLTGQVQNQLDNPGQSLDLYGSNNQLQNQEANLSQVGAMTGQNLFQTGAQNQEYLHSLEARRHGTDAVAANMMAGRNQDMANVGRSFAGRGVAGGVAAAGMNQAQNSADSGINAQMQNNSKSNDAELYNYVKRNQKLGGEALAQGSDQGLAQGMDTSQAQGVFGTVICSELHRQGLMNDATYEADKFVGKELEKSYPTLMRGYRKIATPVVYKMIASEKVTKFIAFFALPWAKQIATGKMNFLGSIVLFIGVPLCFVVGMFVPTELEA